VISFKTYLAGAQARIKNRVFFYILNNTGSKNTLAVRWAGWGKRLSYFFAAHTICGSNLFLKDKEIEFTPKMHWAALREALENIEKKSESLVLVWLFNQARTYFLTSGATSSPTSGT
jgi:hypothetical protein